MTTTQKKLYYALMYLPLLITIAALFFVPDQVPAHYGMDNQVTRWGSKYELLIGHGFSLLMGYFMLLVGKKTENQKVMSMTGFAVVISLGVMNLYFLAAAWNQVENLLELTGVIRQPVFLIPGILMIIFGFLMPRAAMNGVFGLRTTWSMRNEQVWEKCQSFGGKLFVVSGVLTTAAAVLMENAAVVMAGSLTILIAVCIVCIIYSYVAAKKYEEI